MVPPIGHHDAAVNVGRNVPRYVEGRVERLGPGREDVDERGECGAVGGYGPLLRHAAAQ